MQEIVWIAQVHFTGVQMSVAEMSFAWSGHIGAIV